MTGRFYGVKVFRVRPNFIYTEQTILRVTKMRWEGIPLFRKCVHMVRADLLECIPPESPEVVPELMLARPLKPVSLNTSLSPELAHASRY